MTWILRLLLFLVAFSLLRAFFSRLLGRQRQVNESKGRTYRTASSGARNREIAGQTVRDPQCGTHVATSIAFPLQWGGETFYFCSKQCREQFQKQRKAG